MQGRGTLAGKLSSSRRGCLSRVKTGRRRQRSSRSALPPKTAISVSTEPLSHDEFPLPQPYPSSLRTIGGRFAPPNQRWGSCTEQEPCEMKDLEPTTLTYESEWSLGWLSCRAGLLRAPGLLSFSDVPMLYSTCYGFSGPCFCMLFESQPACVRSTRRHSKAKDRK